MYVIAYTLTKHMSTLCHCWLHLSHTCQQGGEQTPLWLIAAKTNTYFYWTTLIRSPPLSVERSPANQIRFLYVHHITAWHRRNTHQSPGCHQFGRGRRRQGPECTAVSTSGFRSKNITECHRSRVRIMFVPVAFMLYVYSIYIWMCT